MCGANKEKAVTEIQSIEGQPAVNIEDEMKQSYMDYAMSVIVGRALPDIRDGLKPVQRRILYAMFREGLLAGKKHSKCAGVVGEVLKKYHPHGDSAVYDALVRLAQDWTLRYPLVDGQGNFGSIDGDPPAAYRYTESRMTNIAEKLLADIDKDTVDFIPNFDDTTSEPLVLPSLVPNLLVNGADGIAVGMATHIPPHNLGEVVDGVKALINNPQITVNELMKFIPGPDFPTGGIIHGRDAIVSAYREGKGIIQLRAKTSIETVKSGNREVEAIIVTEIPYQVNKARLLERIAEMVNERDIEGISRIRDESDRSGMRIVLEIKRDATPEIVLNQLYKGTPLQTSFGIINLAIIDGKPVICSLVDMLRNFVDFRRDVITRRTQFELKKARERLHILEGYRIALLNLDEVIELIRKSQTPSEAKDALCARFELSERQSQAILELRLQRLTGMEQLAVEKEHQELTDEIKRFLEILADMRKVDELIVNELGEIREHFSDKRRTLIAEKTTDIAVEDLIEDEEMIVSVSHEGYIKRTKASEFRAQKRGGKGVTGAAVRQDDFIEHVFSASTLSYLLIFTTLGRVYWQKVYGLPEGGRAARGRALVNLLKTKPDEGIAAILPVREFVEGKSIVIATRNGLVKKTDLMEYSKPRRGGIIATSLHPEDMLIGAGITGGDDELILATRTGMAIRFRESDVRSVGKGAKGVKGIRFNKKNDSVVSMTVVRIHTPEDAEDEHSASPDMTLLTVCENGYGKRTNLGEYRLQGRGGRGVIDIQTVERNGPVVNAVTVRPKSEFMIITSSGQTIRINADEISVIGRNTKGVRLINLEESEKVVAVAPLMGEDQE